jgi:NitT/TauT family transport system ATP-binding protein
MGPAVTDTAVVTRPKLVVDRVSKVYGGRRSVVALDEINMHVQPGELICLLGSSGCGKSTLLNIVGGLDEATTGQVRVDDAVVIGPGADRGMVFQHYSLFPWMSVAKNVGFGLELAKMPKRDRRARVDELLAIMDLREHADRLPRELSGGMRQRVAIARALAPEPDVLLLDEPFAALDAQTRRRMQQFLLTIWRRTACTILMVTHDVEEAVFLSGRVYVMSTRPGRVAAEVPVPFGPDRDADIIRDRRFLDLRLDLADRLG